MEIKLCLEAANVNFVGLGLDLELFLDETTESLEKSFPKIDLAYHIIRCSVTLLRKLSVAILE